MLRRPLPSCLAALVLAVLAGPAVAQAPTPDFTWNNYTGANTSFGAAANSWLVGNTQTIAGAAPTSSIDRILQFTSSSRWLGASYLTQANVAGAFDLNQVIFNSQGTSNTAASTGVLFRAGANAADTFRFNTSSTGTLPAIWMGGVSGSLATGRVEIQNGTATQGVSLNNGTTLQVLGNGVGNLVLSATVGQTGAGNSGLLINQTGAAAFNTGPAVVLSGNNTFAGGVTLTAGNLLLANPASSISIVATSGAATPAVAFTPTLSTPTTALGTGPLTVNGGTLQFDPTLVGLSAGLAFLAGTATPVAAQSGTFTVTNALILNNTLTLTGTNVGASTLATTPNINTSAPGTIAVFSGPVSGTGGITLANYGGALSYTFTGANTSIGAVSILPVGNSAGGIRFGNAANSTGTAVNASAFNISTSSVLILDNQAGVLTRTSGTAPLTLSRSALTLIGNSTASAAESFGLLTVNGFGQTSAVSTSAAAQTTTLTFAGLNRGATGLGTLLALGTNLGSGTGAGESIIRVTADPGGAVGGGGGAGTVTRSILPYAFTESSASTLTAANVVYGLARYDAATQRVAPLVPGTEYAGNLFTTGTSAPAANHRYASTSALPNAFGAVANQPTVVNALVLDTNTTATNRVGVSVAGSGTLTVAGGAVLAAFNGSTGSLPSIASLINTAGLGFGSNPGYVHTVANLTINAPISGSAGVVKSATGTLVLNGANPFTGGLTLNAGPVTFTTDANLGAAGGGITLNGGGSSQLTFVPNNLYTPLAVSTAASSRPIVVGPAGGSVNAALANTVLTLSGNITGADGGQFQKFGSGVVALTGTNSFTGNLNVAVGTLAVGSDAALGGAGASLILSGGTTLQVTSSFTTGRTLLLPNTANATTIILTGNNQSPANLTVNGNLTGGLATNLSLTLLKDGPGDLVLTATSTFQNQVQVGTSGPAVRGMNSVATTTAGRIVLSGANGAIPVASGLLMLGDGETVLDNTAAVNNNRVGTVGVSLNGGKFTLLGNAAADVTEAVGTLGLSGSASAPLGGVVTLSQPTSAGGQATTLVFTTISGGNGFGTVFVRGTNLAGVSGDRTALVFGAAPTLVGGLLPQVTVASTLAAEPTDFGTTTAGTAAFGQNAAQVQLTKFTAYTTSAGPTLTPVAANTFDLTGANALSATGTVNALRVSAGGSLDVGAGNVLTVTAAAVLTTGGANGGISNGTLAFGSTNTPRFSVAAGSDLTVSSLLTGTLGLVKTGGGVLTLSGASTGINVTTSGGFGVGGGTLRYGVANALPVGTLLTVGTGATFDLNNLSSTLVGVQGYGTVALGSGTLTLTGTNGVAFGGTVTGTGGLVKSTAGTATFAGDSPAYAGPISVLGGTLTTTSNTALGTGPVQLGDTTGAVRALLTLGATVTSFSNPITVPTGSTPATAHTLTAPAGVATLAGNIVINNTATTLTSSGTAFNLGAIAGFSNGGLQLSGTSGSNAGGITQTGTISGAGGIYVFSGNWSFAGDNTYTGGTALDAVTSNAIGVGRNSTPSTVGATVTSGPFGTNGVFFTTGFGSNLRADGGARTLANQINLQSTGGYFGVAGTNPLTLNGPLDFQGATVAQTLVILNTAPTTIGGPIQNGTGGITKNGPGELRITGTANTYTGATVVNAGTLRLTGGTAGTPNIPGPVTVNSGAVLTGTGAVGAAGLVTVTAGGVLLPGNSPGTLTAAGGASFAAGAIFRVDLAGAVVTDPTLTGLSGTPGTTNSLLVGGAGTGISFAAGTLVVVDVTGVTFTPSSPYSFTVGQSAAGNVLTGTQPITFLSNGVDITGTFTGATLALNVNTVLLNFTPVPEPATVLAVAGLGLAAVRLRRRVIG